MEIGAVLPFKHAHQYLLSGNEEFYEMLELIVRGLLDGVKDEDIYEACHAFAEPTFGDDYQEYVDELISILRSSIDESHWSAMQAIWDKHGADTELKVVLLEPHHIYVSIDHDCDTTVTESIPVNVTIGPVIQT